MRPIKANLASFEYPNMIIIYLFVCAAVLVGMSLAAMNFRLYMDNADEIGMVSQKIKVYNTQTAKKLAEKTRASERLTEEEVKAVYDNVGFINALIIQDAFPWIKILDLLEKKIPDDMLLYSLASSVGLDKLTLKGYSDSERQIAFFLEALNLCDLCEKKVLSVLSVQPKKASGKGKARFGVEFEIEITLKSDSLISRVYPNGH